MGTKDEIETKLVEEAASKALRQVQKERELNEVPQTHPFKIISEMQRYVDLTKIYLERMKQWIEVRHPI